MAIAYIHGGANSNIASATTITKLFPSNVTAGNLIVVGVGWGDSGTPPTCSVTDTLGNTFISINKIRDTNNKQSSEIFYAKNILGGADTITATFSASANYRRLVVSEYSGADITVPLDGNNGRLETAPGTGTDGCNSLTITPTANGALIWGIGQETGGTTLTTGTNFTLRENAGTGEMMAESLIQSTAASIEATFTASINQDVITMVAAFKEAGGAVNNFTSINIGDTWQTISGSAVVKINIDDTWQNAASAQINIGDVWQNVTLS